MTHISGTGKLQYSFTGIFFVRSGQDRERVFAARSFGSPEVRERAVRVVPDRRNDHPSRWAAVTATSDRYGENLKALEREKRERQQADET